MRQILTDWLAKGGDERRATLRTTWNMAVYIGVVWVIERYFTGIDIDTNSFWIVPATAALGGVFYKVSLVLTSEFPWLGRLLFGSSTSPTYPAPDPTTRQETPNG